MPKLIKQEGITVTLSSEEVNTLLVCVGRLSESEVQERAYGFHGISQDKLATSSKLYDFFLQYSDSHQREN